MLLQLATCGVVPLGRNPFHCKFCMLQLVLCYDKGFIELYDIAFCDRDLLQILWSKLKRSKFKVIVE